MWGMIEGMDLVGGKGNGRGEVEVMEWLFGRGEVALVALFDWLELLVWLCEELFNWLNGRGEVELWAWLKGYVVTSIWSSDSESTLSLSNVPPP